LLATDVQTPATSLGQTAILGDAANRKTHPMDRMHCGVFKVGVVNGDYLSVDFWVCHRLRQMGYRIFVDPEIATRHQGTTQF